MTVIWRLSNFIVIQRRTRTVDRFQFANYNQWRLGFEKIQFLQLMVGHCMQGNILQMAHLFAYHGFSVGQWMQ